MRVSGRFGATLKLDEDETVYLCKNGCVPIVVIGRPGVVAWPGRGYRLGDHVVRNVRDLVVQTKSMGAAMVMSGGGAALMKKNPSTPSAAS